MRVGIETLLERHASWLRGRRVALLSHQAAITSTGATTAQCLREAIGENLVAIFGPEHGYYGLAAAGEPERDGIHAEWGIPIYSLYGERRRPTAEMLRGVDTVVVDFQDIGARCYTYLATMRRMLEAADAVDLRVIIADRPIPLPNTVDGPMLEPRFRSFVADAPLPMAYGMTPGETATWLREELGLRLDLRVARSTDWRRQSCPTRGAPEWLPPSPGIRTWESAQCYLATVFTEALPEIDCGRSTNLAFRLLGAPWLEAPRLCAELTALPLEGARFHMHRYTPTVGEYAGRVLDGMRISVTDARRFQPVSLSVAILDLMGRMHGHEHLWQSPAARPGFFDQLYGTNQVRQALESGESWQSITSAWQSAYSAYQSKRSDALLYRVRP